MSYVDQTPVGDILSRMMDDVSTMGNYVHQIIDTLMTGFFMILAIAVMMLLEDWRLAAIVLVLTPPPSCCRRSCPPAVKSTSTACSRSPATSTP